MGEVDAIYVFKLDRNSGKLLIVIVALTDWLEWGIRLVSGSQGQDFSGTTDKLIAGVLFSVRVLRADLKLHDLKWWGVDVSEQLPTALNEFMRGLWQIEWWGQFSDLVSGPGEFAERVRKGYSKDRDNAEGSASPISDDELDVFGEYLQSYGF